jgi:hypothetical protein
MRTDVKQRSTGRGTHESLQWTQVFSKGYDTTLSFLEVQWIFNFRILLENFPAVVAWIRVYQPAVLTFDNGMVFAVSCRCALEGGIIFDIVYGIDC